MNYKIPSTDPIPQRVFQRFWDRVEVLDWWDCWEWQLSTGSHGYGQIGWWADKKSHMATSHKIAWLSIGNTIPEGFTIDHECRNYKCCNPLHLRLLTNVENATWNGNKIKEECPRGHKYQGNNLYVDPKGRRKCRACRKILRKVKSDV